MIAKLFYQEHLDQSRKIASLLCIILLSVCVSLGIIASGIPGISAIAQATIFISIILAPLFTLLMLAVHYWTSMYTDAGYFTHQIPATAPTLFWAKILYAICTVIVSLFVSVISICGYLIANGWQADISISESLSSAREFITATPSTLIILGVVSFVLSFINIIIAGAGTISYCAQDKYIRHGFAAPAIGLVLYYLIYQATSLPAILFIPGSIRISDGTFTGEMMITDFVDAIHTASQPTIIGLGILISPTILTIIAAWLGIRALRDHLSLR